MKLFERFSVGPMDLTNRIAFPPCVSLRADLKGFVTKDTKEFYLRIAKGGAGMVEVEATHVMRPVPGLLALCHEAYMPGFRELVELIHNESDAKLVLQLYEHLPGYFNVEDVPVKLIGYFVDCFCKAAERAMSVGFDGVEVHAAHAYWIASFLSVRNKRVDEYGGNLEGRMKLLLDIIEGIKLRCGDDFPVGVRINGDDCIVGGNTLQQTRKIARKLVEKGIAYLSVSAGGKYQDAADAGDSMLRLPYALPGPWHDLRGYSGHRATPPAYMPDGTNVHLASEIRKSLNGTEVPVMTAGKIPTADFAETILEGEQADFIGVCRPILCDPEWVHKWKAGKEGDVVRCGYCLGCMEQARLGRTGCVKWKNGEW
jgi:2,4-dienoyl-CoA reductase-like NADH-dependent reductase (Old Yellow Enzyme family)